jgi:hypothetical protein
VEIAGTDSLSWVDPSTDQPVSALSVVAGETIEFHVINDSAIPHNFHIGAEADLSAAPEQNDLPGVDTFTGGTQTFTYTVEELPDQPQFACTVPGHYQTMHGDLLVQEGSGEPGSSEAPAGSEAPTGSEAPAATEAPASPAASVAP